MRLPEPPAASIAAAALATAVALAGCATSSIDLAPEASDRPWQPQTSAAGDIVPGRRARPRQVRTTTRCPRRRRSRRSRRRPRSRPRTRTRCPS